MIVGVELFFLDDGRPVSRAKRVARAVLALAFAAALPAIVAVDLHGRAAGRRHPVVPCTVVAGGVEDRGGTGDEHPYKAWVAFAFEFRGQRGVGHRFSAADDSSSSSGLGGTTDAADAYALADRYAPGTLAACHVDPTDVGRSCLVGPVPAWEPWAVPVGLAIVVGVGALYCWPQLRLAWGSPHTVAPTAGRRRWTAVGWGTLLLAGAGGVTTIWWVWPICRTVAAGRWPALPCVVESARVHRHRDSGEVPITTYRTDVLYRYVVGTRTYHSNQYSLTESASPAAGGRRAVAAAYPVGRPAVCYVDPADPTIAVLTRRVSPTVSFGLFPLAVTAVGAFMVVAGGSDRPWPRLGGLLRRRWLTLTTAAVVALAWGVFGRP